MDRLHNLPQLRRLQFLGQHSQALVAAYVKHLEARQYAPTTIQTTIDALNSFCRLVPLPRQPRLYQDLATTTAEDVEAWLHASHYTVLAPSTINHLLSVMHRFFAFLQDHGRLAQQPINWRRHRGLVPQTLPKPMAEEDLLRLFQVINGLRDRTMFR